MKTKMTDQWFVYEHVDGGWHVKRYSYLAYDDARMSDFVKRVHGTFPSRTEALEYIHKQNGSVVTALEEHDALQHDKAVQ